MPAPNKSYDPVEVTQLSDDAVADMLDKALGFTPAFGMEI
jgi:hypothetical protein